MRPPPRAFAAVSAAQRMLSHTRRVSVNCSKRRTLSFSQYQTCATRALNDFPVFARVEKLVEREGVVVELLAQRLEHLLEDGVRPDMGAGAGKAVHLCPAAIGCDVREHAGHVTAVIGVVMGFDDLIGGAHVYSPRMESGVWPVARVPIKPHDSISPSWNSVDCSEMWRLCPWTGYAQVSLILAAKR
jgi:hypothetical protein